MKRNLIYTFFTAFLIFSASAYSQNLTDVTYLNDLDSKVVATYGDALIIFRLQTGRNTAKKDVFILKGYSEKDLLTKGMASRMAAEYLNLKGSLMYNIFGSERYAFRACVADGIFNADGSENDKMSGAELIDMISRISDRKEGEK